MHPTLLNTDGTLDIDALLAFHHTLHGDAVMTQPDPPAPPAPTDPPSPPAPPAPAPPTPPAPTPPAPTDPQDVASLPEWAQKLVGDLRKEAGDKRTALTQAEQQQQAILKGVAEALGIKTDEPPDPAKLQATVAEKDTALTAAQAQVRAQSIQLAAMQSALKQGVNAVALLDSRSFVDAVSKLDPAADDFTTQLDTAVKTAVDSSSLLRAGQAPPRGGGEFPGGPGGGPQQPDNLHDAVAARLAGTG